MTAWTNFVGDNINTMPGTTPQQRMKACANAYRGSSGKTATHKVKHIRKTHKDAFSSNYQVVGSRLEQLARRISHKRSRVRSHEAPQVPPENVDDPESPP